MRITKKEWKQLIKDIPELEFRDWLDYLPVTDTKGNAIKVNNPIVIFKYEDEKAIEKKLNELGYKLISSTVWYIEGYHYPKGYTNAAIGFHADNIK